MENFSAMGFPVWPWQFRFQEGYSKITATFSENELKSVTGNTMNVNVMSMFIAFRRAGDQAEQAADAKNNTWICVIVGRKNIQERWKPIFFLSSLVFGSVILFAHLIVATFQRVHGGGASSKRRCRCFDLEDADDDGQSKMDELWTTKSVEIPTEASLERNEQTQPMYQKWTAQHRPLVLLVGEEEGEARRQVGLRNLVFCCKLTAFRSHGYCEMHKCTRQVVCRQLKNQDRRELDWIKQMEKERMTDKQK